MGISRSVFLDKLYEYCEGDIELRALPSKHQTFIPLFDNEAIDAFCNQHANENVYFAVATRKGGGTKDHIVDIPSVWVDIDFKDIPWQRARTLIKGLELQPTFVVMSGGGYHAYWMLKEAYQKEHIIEVEKINKALAVATNGDLNACDASRILRLPDTKNQKYNPPRKVECKHYDPACVYDISDFGDITDLLTRSCISNIHTIYNTNIASVVPSNTKPQLATVNHSFQVLNFNSGHRDNSIFHVANCLVKGGMDADNIYKLVTIIGSCCNPPFDNERELRTKVESALKRTDDKNRVISEEIESWVLTTDGHFLTTDCHKDLQLTTVNHKKAANMALLRLVEKGVLEKYGEKRGCYRLVDKNIEVIDYLNAKTDPIELLWPLPSLTAMVEVMPKNIVLIAGEQNSGKTAFMLDFTRRNMENYKINYFSSEMGGSELKKRLEQFGDPLSQWKFTPYNLNDRFDVHLDPGGINIIDFLELHDNFYQVGGKIRKIYDKLENGIALIALQKKKDADFGRGGEITAEKPRLYLTLSQEYPGGRCKIVKAKNWATSINPNGYSCKYKLIQGCRFIEDGEWELNL